MTESTDTKITRPSIDEAYGSLTWFDEQAIRKHFDVDVHDLMEGFVSDEGGSLRETVALVRVFEFIAATRDGAKTAEALDKARNLTAREVNDIATAYLEAEDELDSEVSADEPVTEVGKDGSASE